MFKPSYILILALIVLTGFGITKCTQNYAVKQLKKEQAAINRQDSIQVAELAKIRAAILRQIKPMYDTIRIETVKYITSKQKAQQSVNNYQNKPNLANCDTAVTDLLHQVKISDTLIDSYKLQDSLKNNLITNYKQQVSSDSLTKLQLNAVIDKAINQASKPKRLIKPVAGIGGVMGADLKIRPGIFAGIGISF